MNGLTVAPASRQDGQRRGDVPQVDVQFDIGVGAAGRDIGETQRARAIEPWHGTGGDDAVGQGQEGFARTALRPAEFDGGAGKFRSLGGMDRRAVQRGAGTPAGGEGFLQRGCDDNADHGHVAVEAAERDAESLAAAHEIRGAVDRIDHPAQAARAGTAALLALEAVDRIGMRETFGQHALDRAIGLGEPVLRAFQLRRRSAGRRTHPQGERGCLGGKADGGVETVGECGHLIPARMKLCTNCRWNSRKATSKRRAGHQRGSGDDRPVDALVGGGEDGQAHRQRPRGDRVGDHQRPQEIVPVIADRHQAVGDVGRLGERHIHPPQPRQQAAAFQSRGIVERLRDGQEGLTQQEYAEGGAEIRQRDRQDGVGEVQLHQRAVVLHQQHVRHHHELQQHNGKQQVAARESQPREGERGERAQHELRGQDQRDQHHGVDQVAGERRRLPGRLQVGECQRRQRIEMRGVDRRMEGGPHGIEQRQHPQQAEQPGAQRFQAAADRVVVGDHHR